MMNVQYEKTKFDAFQTIEVDVKARINKVFNLISTTEGIQQWFPQLSFEEADGELYVNFGMDDGTNEQSIVIQHEAPTHITFTWAIGEVEFKLTDQEDITHLYFHERMPFEFDHVAEDFTGWQLQIENLKSVAETGEQKAMEQSMFDRIYQDVKQNLF